MNFKLGHSYRSGRHTRVSDFKRDSMLKCTPKGSTFAFRSNSLFHSTRAAGFLNHGKSQIYFLFFGVPVKKGLSQIKSSTFLSGFAINTTIICR